MLWCKCSPGASSAPSGRTSLLDIPPAYRAGRGVSAPPALDWWRGFGSARAHQADRGGADRQSRHRRRHRPHHAGRRAEQDRRRPAASDASTSPAPPPGRSRRAAWSARTTASRSTPPTRSISGARTAPPRAPRRKPRSPPASPRKWSCSSTIAASRTAYFQVLSSQERLRIARQQPRRLQPRAHPDQAAVRRRHRLAARRLPAGKPGRHRAGGDPAARPDAAPEHRRAGGADRPRAGRFHASRAAASTGCGFRG